ncbi:TPA: TetR family transcriptional regulator [Klebsiella michiganensis]|uniref:TetR family transcriptional regulator n=1 Tax=Enterobacter hormaechei TaxID=158836 RepID=UPI00390802EB|nr:TetR family transcriptional regulator [Enterobacter hormaechei subsp. steigerwaltii]HAV1867092.1 TetR family transcriptional regulator [Enterobacter hormaechei subsp. steigerwaltii]
MVRRTRQEAEETRENILDAAEKCFRDSGICRTTLQMIATKAGCTRGAIYWHFREKNDLLKHVVERTPLFLFTEIEQVKVRPDPVMALYQCLLRGIKDVEGNGHLRNVIEMTVFRHEYTRMLSDDNISGENKMGDLFAMIDSVLSEAREKGRIQTDISTKTLSSAIFYVFVGVLRTIILTPGDRLQILHALSAFDFAFDIALGNKEVCNAT